jgi:uncharacterized protein YcbK (DUF882 family)
MKITDHFDSTEFDCHDGTPYPVDQIDDEDSQKRTWLVTRLTPLCNLLEAIRARAGNLPLKIDSGYRTIAYDTELYNKEKGNSIIAPPTSSQHPKGRAADIKHSGTILPHELFNMILEIYQSGLIPELGGIGIYPTFVHVDVRPKSNNHLAIWGGQRPSNIL